MARVMKTISFKQLLNWVFSEFQKENSIFGIPESKFFMKHNSKSFKIFNRNLETPFGPAAGPHTQLAQNIIASYLVGGRFIELKTVQILDNLEIEKPCIDVEDEGYNVEWSQELSLQESFDEYLKAYFFVHLLKKIFRLSENFYPGFVFNMSVGYDLKGIQSKKVDDFIEKIKDASKSELFEKYIDELLNFISDSKFEPIKNFSREDLIETLQNIPPEISNSVTLSTMHGCPSNEIESIAKYLIKEKRLNTYVKLNPTLLGYEFVRDILDRLGYDYILLKNESFEHDLKFEEAIPMIKRLQEFAKQNGKEFGIKLSNTLGVINTKKRLPGEEMYLSGRTLFPLTINLAYKISKELNGEISISYSGGANIFNSKKIIQAGIYPVTYATELLKPGGYFRLHQIVEDFEADENQFEINSSKVNLDKLKELCDEVFQNDFYKKDFKETTVVSIKKSLPLFDCYIAPCEVTCPIEQDVSEYAYLVSQGRFIEAFETIIEKNPLPHITGYICDHQCMTKCTRWEYDLPVLIRDIKKFATEKSFEIYLKNFTQNFQSNRNQIKVAVVGAGPSGLSAAYFLARAGFNVTIFEKTDKGGGTVRHTIPQFRIPQEVIDKDVEFIRLHGVDVVYNVKPDLRIDELKAQGFKYIFIGIGAEIPNELIIDARGNIFDALDFLKRFNRKESFNLGKKVAVIGGGNSAMDAARAALRCDGVEQVLIIYRRALKYMPADREEIDAAMKDGVKFFDLLQPVEFQNGILKCQKMKPGEFDQDGRPKSIPVENEFEEFRIDSVITAIGEHTDYEFLKRNKIDFDSKLKLLVNAETNETNIENVFVGGDTLRGPSTVVESISDGKKAAEEIIRREGINVNFKLKKDYRKEMISRQIELRGKIKFSFDDDLIKEASRCLMCDSVCNKCVEVCPNRANVSINVDDGFKDQFQIVHIDKICNECGNCETFCPYNGKPFKDKFTIFSDEIEFNRSESPGFFINGEFIYIRTNKNNVAQRIKLEDLKNLSGDYQFIQRENEKIWKLTEILVKDYSYLLEA
ncbi:MAG: putative selenate reductase subunit YgfK [Ignavibacteria bacterium]